MDQSSSSSDPPQNSTRASRNWKKLALVRGAVSRLANASRDGEAGSNPGEPSEIRTPRSEHLSGDLKDALLVLSLNAPSNHHLEMFRIYLNFCKGQKPTMREIKIIEDVFKEYKDKYSIDQLVDIQKRVFMIDSNNNGTSFWNYHFKTCDIVKNFLDAQLEGNTIEDFNEPQIPNEENPMEEDTLNTSSLCVIVENVFNALPTRNPCRKEIVVKFVNEVVKCLHAYPTYSNFESIKLWWDGTLFGDEKYLWVQLNPSRAQDLGTALHWAVELEDKTLVDEILASEDANINAASNWMKGTPLHMAVLKGNLDIVRQLLQKKEKIRLTEADIAHRTPIEIAHTMGFTDIERALMECDGVRVYVDALYKNRQVYVDAANAILVGAALIASVTFASWLQPPMGYTLQDHVNVEDNGGLQAFWVFNSLSFYFAMGTVVFGARSVLPQQNVFIRTIVEKLRINLLVTSILLGCSVFFVIIAFGIAGCIVLTPTLKVQWTMIAPTIVGGLTCIISLGLLFRNIWNEVEERKGARSGNTNQYFFPKVMTKKPSLIQRMMFR